MKKTLFITHSAVIAAIYVVLSMLANALGLASGAIQFRISEALTILPVFTPAAIPGLTIGCIISNVLTGCTLIDIVFGSVATLIGAIGTYLLRKSPCWLTPLPPIIANTVIVPLVLYFSIPGQSIPYLMLTVFIGEFVCCGILGLLNYKVLEKSHMYAPKAKTEIAAESAAAENTQKANTEKK